MATNFSYVNESLIDLYYDDYDLKNHIKKNTKLTIEASFTGPKVSQMFENLKDDISFLKKLEALFDYLQQKELVDYVRPNHTDYRKLGNDFILEEVEATKFIFPKSKLAEIHGLNHLGLWLIEPKEEDLSDDLINYTGTFLYLIETLYDKVPFQGNTMSGCCALQSASNIITGNPFYKIDPDEKLGRKSIKHPKRKLEDMGAFRVYKQKILTLYRKRYMSNEQSYKVKYKKYRCCDLIGYPLFISLQK